MLFRQKRSLDVKSKCFNLNLLPFVFQLAALACLLLIEPSQARHRALPQLKQASTPSPVPSDVSDREQNSAEQSIPTCKNAAPSLPLTNLVSGWVKAANWVEQPEMGIGMLVQKLGPQISSYLNPSAWPDINQKARSARVPVVTYGDILPQKEDFFDITPEELEQQLRLIRDSGLTPISLDQLVAHLRTGIPLPEKPILLTFDDGYESTYKYVYPLLKQYRYPAVFSIYTSTAKKNRGREYVTGDQIREMASNPLVTLAVKNSDRLEDAVALSDARLQSEIVESKRQTESELGIPIRYFTYTEGKYDDKVQKFAQAAGYEAGLTTNELERLAGESKNLLAINRISQTKLQSAIAIAWGGPMPSWGGGFDFSAPIKVAKTTIDKDRLIMVSGGKPITIHANSRYQVPQIITGTNAVAAVDGGFFSLHYLNSNEMIGPVLSQNENKFIPGFKYENTKSTGRPLVLISPQAVKFVPFDQTKHNTLKGIQTEMPNVTDAFIAAGWLVKDSQPQPASTFSSLVDFNVARNRAFWGINQEGQPKLGVSIDMIDSVSLGAILAKAGFRDAVMVDSGASSSLAYKGKSLMANLVGYVIRPVPHVVALVPSSTATDSNTCVQESKEQETGKK